MALNTNQIPVYGITPKTSVGLLNAASAGTFGATTNSVTVYTAPSAGAIITSIVASSNDSAAVNLLVAINKSGTVEPLGIVNVPITSGTAAGVLNTNVLDPTVLRGMDISNSGKPYILLGNAESLIVSVLANMTAAKACYVTAQVMELA